MKETRCDDCGVKITKTRVKVKGISAKVNHFCDKTCLMQWLDKTAHEASTDTAGGFLLDGGTNTPPLPKSRAKRLPDPLFDALAQLDGGKELTTTAARAVGVALAQIKRATVGVTPEMIVERGKNLALHFTGCAVTASSLSKHWARAATAPTNGHRNGFNHNHNIDDEVGVSWEKQAEARLRSLSASQANL